MRGTVRFRALAGAGLVFVQIVSAGLLPDVSEVHAQTEVGVAEIVPNRFIVRLKGTSEASAASVAASYDARSGVSIDQIYTNVFSGFAGEFTNQAALDLAKDPNVLDVWPDRLSYLAAQTNPPGIDRIDADLNPTKAGNGNTAVNVDIAVLDTGIYKHHDLNVVGGKDCTISQISGPYHDISGHGTHVAGTAAAKDNGTGVVGVAPGARLWAVKIFSDDGGGAARESEVTCALDYVRANSATIEVINLSIGANYGYDLGGCAATAYHQAYCNVVNSGVTVVAAAQNWTINARTVVPAQFDEVITVSAYYDSDGRPGGLGVVSDCTPLGGSKGVQTDDTFACFSNYGHDIDISAPGMDVYSTYSLDADAVDDECPSEIYCYMSGTSMATPHVAGAIGLIKAQQGRMSPSAAKARLLMCAVPGPVPLDPDGIKEPMLNVAELDIGELEAPNQAKVGQVIEAEVEEFTPGTRAIFRFNGIYMGGDTIDDEGLGSRTYTIPAIKQGTHKISVTNGLKTVTRDININPLIRLDITSGPVGETVNVTLRGFGSLESVLVTFDTGAGTRSMVRVTASAATGSADTAFIVPPSTDAKHRVTATGNQGNDTWTYFVTRPSAYISGGTPNPDALVRAQFRGFEAGEAISFRFDSLAGVVLGSAIASPTGSGSEAVRIPADASNGTHYLWLVGDQGNSLRISLAVSGAGVPVPTPTPVATAPSTATATASSTESPTQVPTEIATVEDPTETPTAEVPTDTATPAPTESPTEIPTEKVTEVSTETATEVLPTDTPTETEAVVIPTETPTPEG